ncbi:S41 family peptidase [Devosia sp. A369]
MLKRVGAASLLALMAGIMPALAEPTGEAPRWLRFATISPDGETVSFTHRGQIFVVPADGGLAVPISSQLAYSHHPVWSADSERLAFASDIGGDDDVYVTDFSGTLERLTFSSAAEMPTSFSPDGQSVLFEALRLGDAERSVQGALSRIPQLYAVNLENGRESLVLPNQAHEARWNKDQTKLVYSYDPSSDPKERQFRVAANARQLWIYDAASGEHERVFPVDGFDRLNPVWSADGAQLTYLSEASGWLNVWQLDLASGSEIQLTNYTDDAVRDLSVAQDGTIAYTYLGRIYVKAADAEAAAPIEILTLEQHASNRLNLYAESSQGFASSPDGELFAHIANTDVFLADTEGNYRRVTDTPGEERSAIFSPDGSLLVYAAQRDHQWGLYAVDLKSEETESGLAISYQERPLVVPEDGNAMDPQFSPDGSKIAFIADRREVRVLDLATGMVTQLFGEGDYNSTYVDGHLWFSWSPNSKELAVDWNTIDATELRHVAIVPADGSARPRQIGNVPDLHNYVWSLDGTQLVGSTTLYGTRDAQLHARDTDLYRIFLSEKARQDFLDIVEGDRSGSDLTEENAIIADTYAPDTFRSKHLEARLAPGMNEPIALEMLSDRQHLLALVYDGEELALNIVDLATGEFETIATIPAPELQNASYVAELGVVDLKLPGKVLRVPLSQPDQLSEIAQNILFTRDADAARAAAFEQAWADIKYRYYDAGLEGRDWDAIGGKYRAYVSSVASNRELVSLISAMLGELSASHLFVSYSGSERTALGLGTHEDSLGIYLDHGYEGPGRRVADVLAGGPLDRQNLGINAGDIITSINGQPVPDAGGLDKLLDLNVGRQVLVGVQDDGEGSERQVQVIPISQQAELGLANARLINARGEMVQRLSNSCIAYQYVPEMGNGPYLDLLATLSATRGVAKAALVDVRSNGGGNLTRELITLLTGTAYATMGRDDGAKLTEPNNRWVWPSAVLVDSFGYSDGSVFPQAYQDNAIGKLVGDTVLNTGTAVNYVESKIVPGLTYGIPVLPWRRLDGTYYENFVIEPEISVPFDPNHVGLNTDPQLEAAVASLMAEIGADADCRLP